MPGRVAVLCFFVCAFFAWLLCACLYFKQVRLPIAIGKRIKISAALFFKSAEEELKSLSAVVEAVTALPVGEAEAILCAEGAEILSCSVRLYGRTSKKTGTATGRTVAQADVWRDRRVGSGSLNSNLAEHKIWHIQKQIMKMRWSS